MTTLPIIDEAETDELQATPPPQTGISVRALAVFHLGHVYKSLAILKLAAFLAPEQPFGMPIPLSWVQLSGFVRSPEGCLMNRAFFAGVNSTV